MLEIDYPRWITLDTNNLSISESGLDELWGFSKALLVVDNMEGETSITRSALEKPHSSSSPAH